MKNSRGCTGIFHCVNLSINVIQTSLHETYMSRCLDLAMLGLGKTSPNPLVGAVIVHENKIIGEGYHHVSGGPHAEVIAINAVQNKDLLKHSTLYVNLEPCSHVGKTPPCTNLIIRSGIPEVVIGISDPNPLVAGNGIGILQNAGIKVHMHVMKDRAVELNRRFLTFHVHRRPYIILKWAQTSDGFIDVLRTKDAAVQPTWISNEISRMIVHKWRSEEQAILVGTHTAMLDNPRLNVREWTGNSPLRMVIDRNLQLPRSHHLFDDSMPTVVFNGIQDLTSGNTRFVKLSFNYNLVSEITGFLFKEKILSLIVEGGYKTFTGFIESGLWDEARVFAGNKIFGKGVPAPVIKEPPPEIYSIREDRLLIFNNFRLREIYTYRD